MNDLYEFWSVERGDSKESDPSAQRAESGVFILDVRTLLTTYLTT
jgi:hypothetical protein